MCLGGWEMDAAEAGTWHQEGRTVLVLGPVSRTGGGLGVEGSCRQELRVLTVSGPLH